MNENILLTFLNVCGKVRETLRDLHIQIENLEAFNDVQTICDIYNRGEEQEVSVSMAVQADLLEIFNDDFHSLGMSFELSKQNEKWVFSGEVGWSGYDTGFDEIDSVEDIYDNVISLLEQLELLVNQLIKKYIQLVNEYIHES